MDDQDFSFRFTCKRSGNCCSIPGGIVRVTDADVRNIAVHLGMSEDGFRTRYVAGGRDPRVEGITHRCVFLKDGRQTSCSIYVVRPEQCRTWPFWEELRDNPEAVRKAMKMCPGIESSDEDCSA